MPSLIWRDVDRIGVHCLIHEKSSPTDRKLEAALCEQVRAAVSTDAPAPVVIFGPVDPALLQPGTVTLLVHANIQATPNERLLVFTIRPFRASGAQTSTLFGSAPRAAEIPVSALGSPALTAAIDAALSETLPWRMPSTVRPIK